MRLSRPPKNSFMLKPRAEPPTEAAKVLRISLLVVFMAG